MFGEQLFLRSSVFEILKDEQQEIGLSFDLRLPDFLQVGHTGLKQLLQVGKVLMQRKIVARQKIKTTALVLVSESYC